MRPPTDPWFRVIATRFRHAGSTRTFEAAGRVMPAARTSWRSQRASRVAQPPADAAARRLLKHGAAERDVGERQATVPEQDGLVVTLAPCLAAGNDLAD